MIRIFRHYISGIYLVLFLLELGIFFAAFFVGHAAHFSFEGKLPLFAPELRIPGTFFAGVMLTSFIGMGLYRRAQDLNDAALLLRVLASFMLATVVMSLVFYALPDYFVGRRVFGYALISALLGVLSCRFLYLKYVDRQSLKRRVLVLGAGYHGNMIQELETKGANHGFKVIGYIPMGNEPVRVSPDRLLRMPAGLSHFAMQADVDEIVVAPDDRRDGLAVDEILDCKMAGHDVVDLLTFFEREAGLLRVDCLNPSWLAFSDGFRFNGGRQIAKRLFDIVASLTLLAIVWPVMLLTALAIIMESGWRAPILYRQVRVGLNWKLFKVIKFRSMRTDAEKDGKAQWARAKDDRVTRVGGFIRKCRIDELPQLFNVLKGEMSFVGPRPERPEFVEKFAETIPYYSERHRVKPGITGWAQLCYPYGSNYHDAIEKLQYDLYYVKNYSLFLDMLIMLQTIEVVLWGKGAR